MKIATLVMCAALVLSTSALARTTCYINQYNQRTCVTTDRYDDHGYGYRYGYRGYDDAGLQQTLDVYNQYLRSKGGTSQFDGKQTRRGHRRD